MPTVARKPRPRDCYEIANRYPRIVRTLKWAAILSSTEAGAAIRDYRDGFSFSGEAVNHYGGTLKLMARIMPCRQAARRACGIIIGT